MQEIKNINQSFEVPIVGVIPSRECIYLSSLFNITQDSVQSFVVSFTFGVGKFVVFSSHYDRRFPDQDYLRMEVEFLQGRAVIYFKQKYLGQVTEFNWTMLPVDNKINFILSKLGNKYTVFGTSLVIYQEFDIAKSYDLDSFLYALSLTDTRYQLLRILDVAITNENLQSWIDNGVYDSINLMPISFRSLMFADFNLRSLIYQGWESVTGTTLIMNPQGPMSIESNYQYDIPHDELIGINPYKSPHKLDVTDSIGYSLNQVGEMILNPVTLEESKMIMSKVSEILPSQGDSSYKSGTGLILTQDWTIECYYNSASNNLIFQSLADEGSVELDLAFDSPLNEWNHLLIVKDGTVLTAYLNGVVVAEETLYQDIQPLDGLMEVNNNMGYLSYCKIYNRGITSVEASMLYNSGNPISYQSKVQNLDLIYDFTSKGLSEYSWISNISSKDILMSVTPNEVLVLPQLNGVGYSKIKTPN